VINLATLSNITTTAKSLSGLILVTPNKPIGYLPQPTSFEENRIREQFISGESQDKILTLPEAYFFNYEGEQSANLVSETTDHYIEDNTAITDHVALKPEEVTTNGFVSELNDVVPDTLLPLNLVREKLVLVAEYTPELSRTTLNAYNRAKFAYDNAVTIANNSVQTWQSLTGTSTEGVPQNKQQVAWQKFYGYWQERRLFTIQTPWAIFDNMIIKSLKSIQSADNEVVSNFEITFKKIRYASAPIEGTDPRGDFGSGRNSTGSKLKTVFGSSPLTNPIAQPDWAV